MATMVLWRDSGKNAEDNRSVWTAGLKGYVNILSIYTVILHTTKGLSRKT